MATSAEESKVPVELDGLDPRYECPICLSCLKEPVLTSCGHRFCRSCLYTWLKDKGEWCPVDYIKLDKSKDLFQDLFTRREILNQRITCRICNAEVSISGLDEHLLSHPLKNTTSNADVQCPFHNIGCIVNLPKDQMAEHLQMQINHHLCLIQASHMKLLQSSKQQKTADALAQEAEFWVPEEKGKVQEKMPLLRALYERVVALEQRSLEQCAQIQRLKSDLMSQENKIQELSALHACGQYLWHVRQFTEKLAAMRTGSRRLIFSPGFYTSPVGYKICGRINVSPHNSDQLALLIHLMESPHDSALKWPFNGRIDLSVIHPTNPDLTVAETMMSRPELESFKRPTHNMNTKAFGYPQFISVSEITSKGYLVNDTLTISRLFLDKNDPSKSPEERLFSGFPVVKLSLLHFIYKAPEKIFDKLIRIIYMYKEKAVTYNSAEHTR